jgi:hypothetical protein
MLTLVFLLTCVSSHMKRQSGAIRTNKQFFASWVRARELLFNMRLLDVPYHSRSFEGGEITLFALQ